MKKNTEEIFRTLNFTYTERDTLQNFSQHAKNNNYGNIDDPKTHGILSVKKSQDYNLIDNKGIDVKNTKEIFIDKVNNKSIHRINNSYISEIQTSQFTVLNHTGREIDERQDYHQNDQETKINKKTQIKRFNKAFKELQEQQINTQEIPKKKNYEREQ